MKTVKYKKEGKGHAIYIDGKFAAWIIGSKKTAVKHYEKHLK